MAQVDLEKMLTKIKATQWGLGDVDWDAPGRERITEEQWPKLKTFMADLMWIEHVGARGFAAAVQLRADAAGVGLFFILHQQHFVNDRAHRFDG